MDMILTNQGLYHVTEQIHLHLNLEDLANCRLVAQKWKKFIDNNKVCWTVPIKFIQIQKKYTLEKVYPNWKVTIDHFLTNETIERLIKFTKFMFNYWKAKDISNHTDWPPLHYAVRKNMVNIVELFIDTPADFNIKNTMGYTPLHYINSIEVLKLFHRCKTDKNIDLNKGFPGSGRTLLHNAISYKNHELVKFILEKHHEYGINIEATDNTGDNTLHYAALYCNTSNFERAVKCFKEDNLDLSVPNADGKTPFMLACRVRRKESFQHLFKKCEFAIRLE